MKKVYIVKGSEDGVLGVFGSVSKARDRVQSYLQGSYLYEGEVIVHQECFFDGRHHQLLEEKPDIVLGRMRKGEVDFATFHLAGKDSITADIEAWEVE